MNRRVQTPSYNDDILYRRRRRQETLVLLRQTDGELQTCVERIAGVSNELLRLVRGMPPVVIYRYDETRIKILERLDDLRDKKDSLNGSLKTTNARHFIAKVCPDAVPSFRHLTGGELVARAHGLLDQQIDRQQKSLTAIQHARHAFEQAVSEIMARVREGARLGLLDQGCAELAQLTALLELCVPGSGTRGIVQRKELRAAKSRVIEAWKAAGLEATLRSALSQLHARVFDELPTRLRQAKRVTLTAAARELSAQLDKSCQENVPFAAEPLARAILALYFSYTTARNGAGGLSTVDQARYERELGLAPSGHVRSAIERLLDAGILTPNDADFFRYKPSVYRPFVEVLGSRRDNVLSR
jgi:hypothetical protein